MPLLTLTGTEGSPVVAGGIPTVSARLIRAIPEIGIACYPGACFVEADGIQQNVVVVVDVAVVDPAASLLLCSGTVWPKVGCSEEDDGINDYVSLAAVGLNTLLV